MCLVLSASVLCFMNSETYLFTAMAVNPLVQFLLYLKLFREHLMQICWSSLTLRISFALRLMVLAALPAAASSSILLFIP